jgi:hypothetical protein
LILFANIKRWPFASSHLHQYHLSFHLYCSIRKKQMSSIDSCNRTLPIMASSLTFSLSCIQNSCWSSFNDLQNSVRAMLWAFTDKLLIVSPPKVAAFCSAWCYVGVAPFGRTLCFM